MGELNTAPMKINKVEGAANEVKESGGPGINESWGTSGGATVASGTYTGDGNNNRQITVGFICTLVVIIPEATQSGRSGWIVIRTAANNLSITTDPSLDTDTNLHAADGFVVDANFANVNLAVYNYWAISA